MGDGVGAGAGQEMGMGDGGRGGARAGGGAGDGDGSRARGRGRGGVAQSRKAPATALARPLTAALGAPSPHCGPWSHRAPRLPPHGRGLSDLAGRPPCLRSLSPGLPRAGFSPATTLLRLFLRSGGDNILPKQEPLAGPVLQKPREPPSRPDPPASGPAAHGLFQMFHKWDRTPCGPLCVAFSSWRQVSEVRPRCSACQGFARLYG